MGNSLGRVFPLLTDTYAVHWTLLSYSTPVAFNSRKCLCISFRFSCLMWFPASHVRIWKPCPSRMLGSVKKSRGLSHHRFRLCGETPGALKKTASRVRSKCAMLEAERTGRAGPIWKRSSPPDRRSPTQRAHPTVISIADGSWGSQRPSVDVSLHTSLHIPSKCVASPGLARSGDRS